MELERVFELISIEYEKSKKLGYIARPLAYALYKVWKYILETENDYEAR